MLDQDNKVSFNGYLILQPYKHSGKIKAKISGGFASVEQKTNLVGLKMLTHGNIQIGQDVRMVPKGVTIYFKEETLHTSDWATTKYSCEAIGGEFILAPASAMVMIDQT